MAGKPRTGDGRDQHSLGIEVEKARVPEWDPRCYDGGNGPNPYLSEWIAEHATPYDAATDAYRREAFTEMVRTSRRSPLYDMHIYWSKKPYEGVRAYIEHYTEPGDIVLDPFCGSGSTALSALMLGRKAIAIDLSPAATFITRNYCCPVDPADLLAAYEEVQRRVAPEMEWLYETRCHRCGGKATTGYTVYSEVFECVRCGRQVPLYDCPEREGETAKGKPKTIHVCPHCDEEVSTTRNKRCGTVPVEVSVICGSGCRPARENRRHDDPDQRKRQYFERCDLAKIAEIEAQDIPYWYPTCRMMNAPEDQERWGVKWRAGSSNFRAVDELFTSRNLRALAGLLAAIRTAPGSRGRDALLFVFSSSLWNCSRMYQQRDVGGGPTKGTYYVPPLFRDNHVGTIVHGKLRNARDAHGEMRPGPVVVSTQSAASLGGLPDASVDYVFTDPAYGDTVQYGELNFVWESWLGLNTHWHDQEIVVNEVRGQDEERWYRLMLAAMRESHRVLKPGRWLSLCYHDTSEGTWDLVQQLMEEAGFIPDTAEEAVAIDAIQKSYNQLQGDQVLKRDLVINFRKPYPGERPVRVRVAFAPGDTPELFEQKVITIVQAFLTKYPGSARDMIWDAVVSRLVRQGDMERHDFDAILQQVAAPNEAGEWHLTVDEAEDIGDSEAAKADAAAAALEKVIARHCEDTGSEGMDYSDILEWYVVQYRGDRPSRQLTDWLPDYLFQAPGGGYRNPASDAEREQKRMGRESGLNRLIRRYLRAPASVEPAPDQASLCDWLRHCYRAGLYEEGCRLVDEGHIRLADLPAEAQGDVEDDAAMCRSRLRQRAEIARVEKPAKKTRARKPKPEQQELGL